MNHPFKLVLLGAAIALSGCSALESEKVNYRSTGKATPLEVPPDLTQLSRDTRYNVNGGAVSASAVQSGQSASPAGARQVAANVLGDVRIERVGNQRWLVVKRSPEKLWDPVKDFWQENGFVLAMDQAKLGIMETDWAENRAKLPMDIVRSTIGRVLDSLYSTSERDKFRTRMEQNAEGETEIFISHRGVQEIFTTEGKETTVWQPRPTDPELEAEFLRRLMLKLGAPAEQVKAAVANAPSAKRIATAATQSGQPVVQIEEGFDRAWRRVGLTLDRTGFTVEDRDRKQGIYFVRYVEPYQGNKEPGFLDKLFSGAPKTAEPRKYQIAVRSQGDSTVVSILNQSGQPDNSETAQRIVKVLADDIK